LTKKKRKGERTPNTKALLPVGGGHDEILRGEKKNEFLKFWEGRKVGIFTFNFRLGRERGEGGQ